jgi:hypothetical protein
MIAERGTVYLQNSRSGPVGGKAGPSAPLSGIPGLSAIKAVRLEGLEAVFHRNAGDERLIDPAA